MDPGQLISVAQRNGSAYSLALQYPCVGQTRPAPGQKAPSGQGLQDRLRVENQTPAERSSSETTSERRSRVKMQTWCRTSGEKFGIVDVEEISAFRPIVHALVEGHQLHHRAQTAAAGPVRNEDADQVYESHSACV